MAPRQMRCLRADRFLRSCLGRRDAGCDCRPAVDRTLDLRSMSADAGFAGGQTGLHWQSHGHGPPVLLIMGLGLSGGAWWRTVPVLSRHFRVITFDNRGVGRSNRPRTPSPPRRWPMTPPQSSTQPRSIPPTSTASRSAAWSPSNSRSAIDGAFGRWCSARHTPVDRGRSRPTARCSSSLRRPELPQEEAAWASVPYNYGPACGGTRPRIAEDVAERLAHPFPSEAYSAQLWAARLHNCLGRLSGSRCRR